MEINRIYNMECIEGMSKMKEAGIRVDAVITDPPYGTVRGASLDGWDSGKATDWDIAIEPEEVFSGIEPILRQNGAVVLFSQEPYTSRLRTELHSNLPFAMGAIWLKDHFANALISQKSMVHYYEDISLYYKKYDSGMESEAREYSRRVIEYIGKSRSEINADMGHRGLEHFFYWNSLQFTKPSEERYKELEEQYKISEMGGYKSYKELEEVFQSSERVFNLAPGERHKSNVLYYPKDYGGLHPTQKPLALMEDLIRTYTNPGDLVLDFTMGSGTTAVACINTGRNFIGFELDKGIYEVALKRVREAQEEERMREYWRTGE